MTDPLSLQDQTEILRCSPKVTVLEVSMMTTASSRAGTLQANLLRDQRRLAREARKDRDAKEAKAASKRARRLAVNKAPKQESNEAEQNSFPAEHNRSAPPSKRRRAEPEEDEEVEEARPTKRPKGPAQGNEAVRPPSKRQERPANIDTRLWGVGGTARAGASVLLAAPALDKAPEAMRQPGQLNRPKDLGEDPELAVEHPDPEAQGLGYGHEEFDMEPRPYTHSREPDLAAEYPDPEGLGFGDWFEKGQGEGIFQYPDPSASNGPFYMDTAQQEAIAEPQFQDTAPAPIIAVPQIPDRNVDFRTVRPRTRTDRCEIKLALRYTRQDYRNRLGFKDLKIRTTKSETYLTQYREMQRAFKHCWALRAVGKAPALFCLDAWSGHFTDWVAPSIELD
ncbi:hypothetical protein MMC07_003872 [Pseudocyphellaria aurata]|nr:hypothetical protein [Pseudocyphellaria aurata]